MRCLRSCRGLGSFRTPIGLGGWTFRLLPLLVIALLLAGGLPRDVQAQSTAPAAPTGLKAKHGDTQATLTWDDPSDNTITSYQWQQKQGTAAFGNTCSTIPDSASSGANSRSYTLINLTNGIEHTFRIRARNGGVASPASNEATATPQYVPAAPTGFAVTPQNGQVWLTWNRLEDTSITGWQYCQRKGDSTERGWHDINNGDANTIAYLVTGLDNDLLDDSATGGVNNHYRFRIRAISTAGTGSQTTPLSAGPQSTNSNEPLKPRGFSAQVSGAEATLTWYHPNDANIIKYQYQRYSSDTWENIASSGQSTVTATVTTDGRNEALRIRSVYAGNVNSPPSEPAQASYPAPEFSEGDAATRSVDENTAADQAIGIPVTATDTENDTLTYSLSGTGAASFSIDTATGQLKTSSALNHETKSSYTVTVSVHNGKTAYGSYAQSISETGRNAIDDTITVTINVDDVDGEAPDQPAAPTYTWAGTQADPSWTVSWAAPSNTGPAITDYDYRYKVKHYFYSVGDPPDWTEVTDTDISGTSVSITGLSADTEFQVQVRATNPEGTGDWSASGTGPTRVIYVVIESLPECCRRWSRYLTGEDIDISVIFTENVTVTARHT